MGYILPIWLSVLQVEDYNLNAYRIEWSKKRVAVFEGSYVGHGSLLSRWYIRSGCQVVCRTSSKSCHETSRGRKLCGRCIRSERIAAGR
jgi:hypothetical protein